jgi:hypothetical protein
MSAFKGTPGPWETGDDVILCADPDMIIGSVFPFDRDGTGFTYGEVTKANARLIAAAPELLEACQALMDATNEDGMTNSMLLGCAIEMAGNAIAKATGEQP